MPKHSLSKPPLLQPKRKTSKSPFVWWIVLAAVVAVLAVIGGYNRQSLLDIIGRLEHWLDNNEASSWNSAGVSERANPTSATVSTAKLNSKTQTSSKPNATNNKKSKKQHDDAASYDSFVAMAKESGLSPSDPLERLSHSLRSMPFVFDGHALEDIEEKSDELLTALHDEIQLLLRVLVQSPDRQSDITNAAHVALEGMHQSLFRVMKHRVALRSPRIITKSDAERVTRHWLSHSLRDILSLSVFNNSHIVLDLNRAAGVTQLDALSRATQLRLYSTLGLLTKQGAHQYFPALQEAIKNGDDLAVALLLSLHGEIFASIFSLSFQRKSLPPNSLPLLTADELLTLTRDAEQRQFRTIAQRINAALLHCLSGQLQMIDIIEEKIQNLDGNSASDALVENLRTSKFRPSDLALIAAHRFIHSHVNSRVISDESVYERLLLSEENDQQGSSIRDKLEAETLHTNAGDLSKLIKSIPLRDEFVPEVAVDEVRLERERRQCAIPRVVGKTLSVEEFHKNFVMRNEPVLVDLDLDEKDIDLWTLSTLCNRHADSSVVLSKIPYGSLFGEAEIHWSLSEYCSYAQAFSAKTEGLSPNEYFKSFVELDIKTDSRNPVAEARASREPLYLFGNDKQPVTSLLRPQIVSFLSKRMNISDPLCPSTFWDYVLSVSSRKAQEHFPLSDHPEEIRPDQAKFQIFSGPRYSGAPMHSHGPAFNFLFSGAKLWNLMPPARDIYTNIHPLEWIATDFDSNSTEYPYRSAGQPLCSFLQQAGQLLYVPRHYSHQVLNMNAENSGFAVEVDSYIY